MESIPSHDITDNVVAFRPGQLETAGNTQELEFTKRTGITVPDALAGVVAARRQAEQNAGIVADANIKPSQGAEIFTFPPPRGDSSPQS